MPVIEMAGFAASPPQARQNNCGKATGGLIELKHAAGGFIPSD